jgi:CBS domain-containing protein
VTDVDRRHDDAPSWSVVWTRGEGCEELAGMLAGGEPVFAEGDLRDVCISARADVIVQRKLTSFDLVDSVASNRFDPSRVASVVAAIGGGPHSLLAGRVAERISHVSGVPGAIVSASRDPDGDLASRSNLEYVGAHVSGLERRLERVSSAGELVSKLGDGTLLVLGAPGGSWLQRQFFGPGRRLIHAAPGGIVVVRSSPRRCFQEVEEANVVGPLLPVVEAAAFSGLSVLPVASDGRLVGLFRATGQLPPTGVVVQDVMEEPLFLEVDDPVDAADELRSFFDGAPIPVVDRNGQLVGVLPE